MALAMVPAIASASIPHSATGMIDACYAVDGGALRVIDTQAGQTCQAGEQPLSWPAAGASATQYATPASVNLPHAGGINTMVLPGPVLPPGIWNVTMGAIIINGTAQADTLRCGLYNGGGLLRGDATTMPGPGYESVSLPVLVTLTTADRINVMCSHDSTLPAGPLQVYYANVVAQQVASRF
jgi:hypothetical protein